MLITLTDFDISVVEILFGVSLFDIDVAFNVIVWIELICIDIT